MRIRVLGLAALLALALGFAGAEWLRRSAPGPDALAPQAIVALPILPPAPAPTPAAPPPPPVAADTGSDLPTVEVAAHNVHTVDDAIALPIPTVTLHQKDGRVIEHTASLEPAQRPAPAQPQAASVGGTAKATGGAGLTVAGLPVRLFGVRPPDPRDRCGTGTAVACDDGARSAVAARLGTAGNVKCTMPAGQRGDPGYVCRDGAGVDLGGLLVAEGLALADTGSSYDYIGAQDKARSTRRGLWAYR
jgi:endonuclease YncB( thermonuclease family)